MDEMYREYILEHASDQRNKGLLDPADIDHEALNPLCGDRLRLTLRLGEGQVITAVGWDGEGCAISQASASLLGERIIGMTLEEIGSLTRDDVLGMIGISLTMNRMKCALLSLRVLIEGVHGSSAWRKKEEQEEDHS